MKTYEEQYVESLKKFILMVFQMVKMKEQDWKQNDYQVW